MHESFRRTLAHVIVEAVLKENITYSNNCAKYGHAHNDSELVSDCVEEVVEILTEYEV